MELNLYHACAVGVEQAPEFVPVASTWFEETRFYQTDYGFTTSLVGQITDYTGPSDILDRSDAAPFIDFLTVSAKKYLTGLGYEVKDSMKVKKLWLNEMRSEQPHPLHAHYGFAVSGSFYVQVPQGSSGILLTTPMKEKFMRPMPIANQTVFNASHWQYTPKPGDLIMWPSYVLHEVTPGEFEGARRSIAFDIDFT